MARTILRLGFGCGKSYRSIAAYSYTQIIHTTRTIPMHLERNARVPLWRVKTSQHKFKDMNAKVMKLLEPRSSLKQHCLVHHVLLLNLIGKKATIQKRKLF